MGERGLVQKHRTAMKEKRRRRGMRREKGKGKGGAGAEIVRLPAWRHWRRQTKRSNGRQTGLGHMLFTENIQYANYGLQKITYNGAYSRTGGHNHK